MIIFQFVCIPEILVKISVHMLNVDTESFWWIGLESCYNIWGGIFDFVVVCFFVCYFEYIVDIVYDIVYAIYTCVCKIWTL